MGRMEFGRAHVPSLEEALEVQELAFAVVWQAIDSLPVGDALAVLNAGRGIFDAREAELLAARLEAGASERSVTSLLQDDEKTSKRTAKKRTRRAKAVNKNPKLAKKMKTGELSADQADVIADAADKTDGAAAADDELVDKLASTPPDQGRKLADEWVRAHTEATKVQDRYDRQRRLRNVKRWKTNRDTHMLALEGDETTIDEVENAIRNKSADLYRADGGRGLPPGQHPRTRDQRNYDAAIELLTRPNPAADANKTNKKNETSTATKAGRRSPRSTIVITMTAEQASGIDSTPVRQVGGGLLAPTMLEELFCGAELVGLVTDGSGMPLWMGHNSRLFTHQQWLALIARDGGCVQCGAHYSMCEAHHIIPWEAPARGPTDIDNGALVCTDCHHRLHDHNLILIRDPDTGTWSTRAARPDEIAPKRRPRADQAHPHHEPDSKRRPEHRPPNLNERTRTGTLF